MVKGAMKHLYIKRTFFRVAIGIALTGALTGTGFAQQQNPPADSSGGWRRFDPAPNQNLSEQGSGPQADLGPANAQIAPPPRATGPAPSDITIPAGTWLTVRVNEPISSKHNHSGDSYSATLSQPLIADGYVIARRGQAVAGRVADSDEGGRVKGISHLSLELTDLTLVDGQQVPVRTELSRYEAGPSKGRDAAAIGATTGVGAAIGAAAAGGIGAAAGAGAGAIASTIGVLSTHGKETVVLPEDRLTFRTTAPITISTARATQAFQPVQQSDYEQRPVLQRRVGPPPPYGYGYAPYAYGPYPYGYPYYGPGFYGPGIGFGYYGRFGRRW
jgi:hypothetical protein